MKAKSKLLLIMIISFVMMEAAVFAVENLVSGLENHFFVLRAVACGYNFTLQRFLLGGVWDDDAADGLCFGWCWLDEHAVCKWFDVHSFDIFKLLICLLLFRWPM